MDSQNHSGGIWTTGIIMAEWTSEIIMATSGIIMAEWNGPLESLWQNGMNH
jgi:hypothetical protein